MFIKRVMTTADLFNSFKLEVLNEHKNNKKIYDECVETYIKTMLFDFSNLEINNNTCFKADNNFLCVELENIQVNLPADSMFIKASETMAIFLHDYDMFNITGCIYVNRVNENISFKIPFSIQNIFNNKIKINFQENKDLKNYLKEEYKEQFKTIIIVLNGVLEIINQLNNRVVLLDEIKNPKKEYHRFKNKLKSTVVTTQKPIYIVLNANKHAKNINYDKIPNQGILKRDFSFPVIGHWRRLSNSKAFGKDKNVKYCIVGFTWVNNFIKGDKSKSLIQKERIIY